MKHLIRLFFAVCVSIFSLSAFACNSDEIDVLGDGTQCETSKFELTTTSFSGNFSVAMAFGGTIYIDWGDGSAIETITPADTTSTTYTHSYSVTEPHTIRFGGTATEYNTDTCSANSCVAAIGFYVNSSQTKVASISGSLADLFPQYGTAAGEFPRFYTTFGSATNLTQIPSGLFTGLTGGSYMFYSTFSGAGIRSIPETLFSDITTGKSYMFQYTFRSTRLTSLPETLFSGITTGAQSMFDGTFRQITSLSGNVPNTLFSGLINNGSPQTSGIMSGIFYGVSTLSTTCPTGQVKYMTGYESFWNGAVSCRPECSNGLIGAGLSDCVPSKFEITTTSFSGNFSVTFAATGTYYIDWGDGSVQTIVRKNTTAATYTHSYSVAEPHTIKFAGLATAYNAEGTIGTIRFNQNSSVSKIASISGSLADVFPQYSTTSGEYPRFIYMFSGATNLTQIPNTLFTGLTGGSQMFRHAFNGCTGLQSLPSGLFSSITSSGQYMFENAFKGCTGLQSLPSDLFSGLTRGAYYMFQYTFKGCTGLQSLPAGLFSGIRTGSYYLFKYTFDGCTNLSGWVPPTMFAGLIANNSPKASDMWTDTFNNTNLATSCPSPGMSQYITKYESVWNGVVSCECATGYYGDDVTCTACTNKPVTNSTYTGRSTTNTCPWECDHGYMENNNQCDAIVCSGATYYDDNYTNVANACVNCPTGYNYNTTAGKTDISECQIHCDAGTWNGEYTQLEYIESNGTQVINTGYVLQETDSVEVDYELRDLSTGGDKMIVAQTTDSNAGMWVETYGSTNTWYVNYGSTASVNTAFQNSQTSGTFIVKKQSFEINGTNILQPTFTRMSSNPLTIFARLKTDGTVQYGAHVRISGVRVKNGSNETIMNLIPAKNSNDVLGLFDTVSVTFFTNGGTGTFTAGPDTNTILPGLCTDAGAGYWSAGGIVNFDSTLISRTACPAGTYNPTTNGASAAACLSCPVATYNGETAAASCTACPSGYDHDNGTGNTAITDCQIQCPGGTWNGGYTQLEYIHFDGTDNTGAYINTGLSLVTDVLNTNTRLYADAVLYSGQASDHAIVGTGCAQGVYIGTGRNNKVMACWANGATGSSGNTSTTMQSKRLIYDLNLSAGTFTIYDESAGTYITNASGITPTTGNTVIPICVGGYSFYSKPNTVSAGRANMDLYRVKIYDRNTLLFDGIPVRRDSDSKLGLYDTVSGTFKTTPSGVNPVTAGPDGLAQCFDVGSGYYAGASTVNYGSAGTRNACPAGTFTVGYGHGADEANDCGRILHLGDSVIYTRRNKPTTPALNIRMDNGDMYYIGLSTTDHTVSRLHFQTGETKYTAFDDSLYYGERDYDTGEKITQ